MLGIGSVGSSSAGFSRRGSWACASSDVGCRGGGSSVGASLGGASSSSAPSMPARIRRSDGTPDHISDTQLSLDGN